MLRTTNPSRWQQINAILQQAQAAMAGHQQYAMQQHAAQQHQQEQMRQVQAEAFNNWARNEDAKFEAAVKNESKETYRAVQDALPDVLARYGIDVKDMVELYR